MRHWNICRRKMYVDPLMTTHDLSSWYEANLPAAERKTRGHFSTPPRLVEQILDACGYTPAHDLSHIRVLDPACGSGNFLVGAARRLLDAGEQHQLTTTRQATLLQQNLWGLDPDPVACFLATMQLHQTFTALYPQQTRRCKELLRSLHIHQADSLTLPWQQCQNVDLFLANPPYLAAKNTDLSGYRTGQSQGPGDSYLLFLRLALQVVRPHGWIGLVLPDPVLARANATKERQRLLAETTIHHLWHLADVFSAYVGAVVIIAQKAPPRSLHQVSWQRARWTNSLSLTSTNTESLILSEHGQEDADHSGPHIVAQGLLHRQPGSELRYLLSHTQHSLTERLHTHLYQHTDTNMQPGLTHLEQFIQIRRGEELGKDSPLILREPLGDDENDAWYPVLRGGSDIRPYTKPTAQHWIARSVLQKPLERYLQPKLLVVKSAGRLQATLDIQGHVVLQTLYILSTHAHQRSPMSAAALSNDELYFFLALLNSRLLQDYVYTFYTAYKWVQPQIEQHVIAQLPVPLAADYTKKEKIIQRARLLLHTCSQPRNDVEWKTYIGELQKEQENAICALYEEALAGWRPQQQNVEIDKGVTSYG